MDGNHLGEEGADVDKGDDAPGVGREEVLFLLQVGHRIGCCIDYRFRFVVVPRRRGRLLRSGRLVLVLSSLLLPYPIPHSQIASPFSKPGPGFRTDKVGADD